MIKVLLADDQELIRQSLSFVMSKQEDIEMVGTAANGREALELVEEKQPDVVLLDIRMPEMDGVECTRRIKQEFPGIKVIILTTFDDDDYVFDALRYGASGYLLKGVSVDGLTNAVREAARGGSIIAPDVASKVLQMFSRMAQGDVQVRVNKKNALELTKMEWQVIREVGCGLSNKEIAGRLYLSEGTVRNYISSILRKLELRDRTQLAIWAVQNQNSQPEADVGAGTGKPRCPFCWQRSSFWRLPAVRWCCTSASRVTAIGMSRARTTIPLLTPPLKSLRQSTPT